MILELAQDQIADTHQKILAHGDVASPERATLKARQSQRAAAVEMAPRWLKGLEVN